MFKSIVSFAVRKKLFVSMATVFLLVGGIYSMLTLPVDAVPDITNNQVQVVTVSPTLAPQEVEQLITQPIEIAMSNIMNVEEIRSVSRFGLSLVTVVFKESVPTLDARQLVNEQIQSVSGEIPSDLGTPELMPITTGLGEIYQYVLKVEPGYEDRYDAMELRTIQDWIVKRQLSGIPGIVEINSFGGYLKQYEVAMDPDALNSLGITISDVYDALNRNNQNTGGSYIEKKDKAYYIRSEGMLGSLEEIGGVVVANRNGIPVHVRDLAKVRYGSPNRFGAMTKDGEGECVGGIAMMLKGANANVVTRQLEERMERVQKMLPEGVSVEPYLDRSELVNRNISTVIRNLIEGALIVFVVLMLFLGNVRAGLIVASVIPLAMLFGFILMRLFGVSANLMSLGAIDFGIVVDGSIVIMEGIMAHLYGKRLSGRHLSRQEMDGEIEAGAGKVVRSATFAVLIILIVFFPILTLDGIEGKYFTPMAKTLVFCIVGALLLSLTYVPMMSSLFLGRNIRARTTVADRFFRHLNRIYQKALAFCLHYSWQTVTAAFVCLALSVWLFTRLGAEFIPTLDEGDFAMQMTLPAGSSLSKSIDLSLQAEKVLKENFPEIEHVVAKIGTAEVPTDPMAVEDADVMIVMRPFKEWTSASSRAEMVQKMKRALASVPGAEFNFSQPIQLRFNELMTGAKADIAIKLYGEDMAELYSKAQEAAAYVEKIPGASDVLVEQAMGLPQLVVKYDREKIARYGINIEALNTIVRTAYAGETAGVIFENERRFDMVLRLDDGKVKDLNLDKLFVRTSDGIRLPLSEVASIELVDGPLQINRDAAKRRVVIGVNVRDADIQQVVSRIRASLDENVKLKPGYYFEYGGQFENLQNAIRTLGIVIPIALLLILLLLFFAFKSITYTLVVFSTVPLSMIGGTLALWLRGLPFSISAGVGFIALFGVAVLNGILMINHFNGMREGGRCALSLGRTLKKGCSHLLRPVFLTGLVASLGFVPMAVAKTAGAEVQRPLATVVIGGLIVSTVLSLLVIPVYYRLVNVFSVYRRRYHRRRSARFPVSPAVLLLMSLPLGIRAEDYSGKESDEMVFLNGQDTLFVEDIAGSPVPDSGKTAFMRVNLDQALEIAMRNHPRIKMAATQVDRIKASRLEVWEGGNTELTYSRGQMNGPYGKDEQWEISQSIGSLLTPFYKNVLVNDQLATGRSYQALVAKEVVAEVKRAWAYYLYAYALKELYRNQSDLALRLQESGQLRFEQGDISILDRNAISTLATQLHVDLINSMEELDLARRRFSWACYADTVLEPVDTVLELFPSSFGAGLSRDHRAYYQGKTREAESALKVERSRYFPEITLSYSNQGIYPDRGLDSWSVGLSVPLFFFAQHGRSRQAVMETRISRLEAWDNIRQLENKVLELENRCRRQSEVLRYYREAALPQARALQESAILQYGQSEIDIWDFVQTLKSVREILTGYWTAVYEYDISALELELYTVQESE